MHRYRYLSQDVVDQFNNFLYVYSIFLYVPIIMLLVYYDKTKKRLSNSRNMILNYGFIINVIFFDRYVVNILQNVVYKLNILKILIIFT